MWSSLGRALLSLALAAAPAHVLAGQPGPPGKKSGGEQTVDAQVRALIDTAAGARSQEEQQAAFDRVLSLGCAAVPALGAALDDGRRLPVRYIRLENHAQNRFEAFRQYGPETVTDAVAALLNQLTGEHFGSIYNGATPEERAKTVKAWREFIARTPPGQLCKGA
jgi:hypothetical protein